MSGSENESPDSCLPLDSNGTEKGAVNGNDKEIDDTIKQPCFTAFPSHWLHYSKNYRAPFWAAGSLICNVILIITIAAISAVLISERGRETQLYSPTAPVYSCPEDWIGYRGKCYYFAYAEGNWESSRKNCSAFNASLAVIDSQEEMNFTLRYKGPADHWLGLRKHHPDQPWKWTNGTVFDGRFPIRGSGSCAYLDSDGIAASGCGRNEKYICSRSAEREKGTTIFFHL